MERYKLTQASRPNWWRCEDTANGIVQEWANKDYNGSQQTQMADWLQEHHRDKLI